MTNLFEAAGLDKGAPRPLADRLRPRKLGEVVGQDHIVGPEGTLTRFLSSGRLPSLILWGLLLFYFRLEILLEVLAILRFLFY